MCKDMMKKIYMFVFKSCYFPIVSVMKITFLCNLCVQYDYRKISFRILSELDVWSFQLSRYKKKIHGHVAFIVECLLRREKNLFICLSLYISIQKTCRSERDKRLLDHFSLCSFHHNGVLEFKVKLNYQFFKRQCYCLNSF